MRKLTLVLTVAISIGPLVASLSVELFTKCKAKVTGDISYNIGNYSRGRTDCFRGCDPNDGDGTGSYRGITVGRVQTKAYDNGAKSIDVTLVKAQVCDESKIACFKGALSEGVDYNFEKKKHSVPQTWPIYGNSLKSTKISPKDFLSSPKVNEQSAVQRALNQRPFKTDGLPLYARDREVSKE